MNVRVSAGLVFLAGYVLALAGVGIDSTPNLNAQSAQKPASTARTLRLPEVPYRYSDPELPPHFAQNGAMRFDNTPADNPVTDRGATLGRVLFYDTRLSA